MAKNKAEITVNSETLTAAAQDAAHMLMPLTVLFEHPANRARIYGETALAALEQQIISDPRGIARNPVTVTQALDMAGERLQVKDLCRDELLKGDASLAEFVAAHPEMRTSTLEAWYTTSGNHRLQVYRKIGLEQAPVVAQEMEPQQQVRALLEGNNAQPLTRLEIGRYYLEEEKIVGARGVGRNPARGAREGISTRSFAAGIGRSSSMVHDCVLAARVYNALSDEAQKMIEQVNDGSERFTPDHLIALQAIPDIERRSEFVAHAIASEPEVDEKGKPTGKTRWHVRFSPMELKAVINVRVKGEKPETAFKPVWGELGIEDLISPEIMKAISAPIYVPEEDEGSVASARTTAAPPAKQGTEAPEAPAMTKAERASAKKAQKEADRAAFEAAEKQKQKKEAKEKAAREKVAQAAGKKNGAEAAATTAPTRDEVRRLALVEIDYLLNGMPNIFNKITMSITGAVQEGSIEPEEGIEYRDQFVGLLANYQEQLRVLFEGDQLSLGALVTAPTTGDAAEGPDGPEAPPVEEEQREPVAAA